MSLSGGHRCKSGRSVRASGIYRDFVRLMAAILAHVQFHMESNLRPSGFEAKSLNHLRH